MGKEALDKEEEKSANARAAALLEQLEPIFDEKSGFKSVKARLDALATVVEEFKGLNLKEVKGELERLKANHETITTAIKNRRDGFHVSGMETVKFSLPKLIAARQIGYKAADAELERDLLKEVHKKHGDKIYALKGQTIGDDSSGGSFVPMQTIPDVIGGVYKKSAFINMNGEGTQRISVLDGLTGAPVPIPRWDRGMSAQWVGEEGTPTGSKAKTGSVNANPKKLMVAAQITKELLMMAGNGFDTLFNQEIIKTAVEEIDRVIPYGKGGDHQPRGIVNTNGIKIVSAQSKNFGVLGTDALAGAKFQADWTGAEVGFKLLDSLIDLALIEDDVEVDDTASYISSPRYFKRLKNVTSDQYSGQADINQVFVAGPPIISRAKLTELIGDWDDTTKISSALKPGASIGAPSASGVAKHTDIFRGMLSTVLMCVWAGIEVSDDAGKGANFLQDITNVKLSFILDVLVRQPRFIALCPDAKARD